MGTEFQSFLILKSRYTLIHNYDNLLIFDLVIKIYYSILIIVICVLKKHIYWYYTYAVFFNIVQSTCQKVPN